MATPLLNLTLQSKRDVLLARQSTRQLARLLGFEPREQTRVAAGVFEIAYNACRALGRATLHFQLTDSSLRVFASAITMKKPGVQSRNMSRRGSTSTNEAWDAKGVRRLVHRLQRESTTSPRLELNQPLGQAVPAAALCDVPWMINQLARITPPDLFEEIRQQNQELLQVLGDAAPSSQRPRNRDTAA